VGASEAGGCQRLVAYRKILELPFIPNAQTAGVMLPGRITEGVTVEILRGMGFNESILSAVGQEQAELANENIHAHPDGLWCADPFELDPATAYFRPDGTIYKTDEIRELLVGPGHLEIKSGSSAVFAQAIRRGLSGQYVDQVQANMGLSGRVWTLLIFVCRDNFSKVAFFFIPANPEAFEDINERAARTLAAVKAGRDRLAECGAKPDDEDAPDLIEDFLPEAWAERGFCFQCDLRHSCPALIRTLETKEFPEDVRPEVIALTDIMREAGQREASAKVEREDARDRLNEMADNYGANALPKVVNIRMQKGREGVDSERLKRLYPDVYEECKTVGDPFPVVTLKKG
jgi:hypothetical protein